MPITQAPLAGALKRVDSLLLAMPVVEGVLARREAGRSTADDAGNLAALADELLEHQDADGSWKGDVGRTSEALLLLGELLAETPTHERAQRGVDWLRLQDQPGIVGTDLAGHTLANGIRFLNDSDARAGLSALAVRASLRWSTDADHGARQIDALIRLAEQAFRAGRPSAVGAATLMQVLAALAAAPRSAEVTGALRGALSRLASTQRADGSWSGLEAFHVLDLLLMAIGRGYASPLFDSAIMRAAENLALTQRPNGSWGSPVDPYRLLIGWRALRHSVLPQELPVQPDAE